MRFKRQKKRQSTLFNLNALQEKKSGSQNWDGDNYSGNKQSTKYHDMHSFKSSIGETR